MSTEAFKAKGDELRAMRIHHRTTMSLDDLAAGSTPKSRGWMGYCGRFYRSAMYPSDPCQHLPETLGGEEVPAPAGLEPVQAMVEGTARSTAPSLRPLAMGPLGKRNQADEKSPVTGDCHAGINRHGVADERAVHRRSSEPP